MSKTIDEIMNRMKNLREFTVDVDLPDGLTLNGIIPFDASINKNKGRFKVYALSLEEAKQRVNDFLNQ
jgi:hypothetical protein